MSNETEVRPFRVEMPDEAIADLRRRITTTRWPERETGAGDSQGVPLAMMQELARYWAAAYDWRKCEAKLKSVPSGSTYPMRRSLTFADVLARRAGPPESSSPTDRRVCS